MKNVITESGTGKGFKIEKLLKGYPHSFWLHSAAISNRIELKMLEVDLKLMFVYGLICGFRCPFGNKLQWNFSIFVVTNRIFKIHTIHIRLPQTWENDLLLWKNMMELKHQCNASTVDLLCVCGYMVYMFDDCRTHSLWCWEKIVTCHWIDSFSWYSLMTDCFNKFNMS